MSVPTDELVTFLDTYLDIDGVSDHSHNGLQVAASDAVSTVGLATDASLSVYEKAAQAGCDLLAVHHGLIWGGIPRVTGRYRDHIKYLFDHRIALYGAHLPLDLHPEVGNNAVLAEHLGLRDRAGFGDYHGTTIGFSGTVDPVSVHDLVAPLEKALDTKARILPFGPAAVRTVAVVSGGAGSLLEEAIAKKIDCFVTGEGSHERYHQAKEAGIHVVYLGHYKSETVGVRALGEKITERFPQLRCVFIDEPTGF